MLRHVTICLGLAAGCAPERAPAPPTVAAAPDAAPLALTLSQHDGSPPRVGYVELLAPGRPEPLAVCELEDRKRCELATEHRGFARLHAGAVDHTPEELAVVLGDEPLSISVRLGTAAVDPHKQLTLRADGAWQAQALVLGDDGLLRATLEAPQQLRYRVFDLATQSEVNAPRGDHSRGDDGSYWSVETAVDGNVAIVVDPKRLPPPGRPSAVEFDPATSPSALVNEIAAELERTRGEFFDSLKAGKPNPEAVRARQQRFVALADGAESVDVRNAARVAALALGSLGASSDKKLARVQANLALRTIDPTDGVWSLDTEAIAGALKSIDSTPSTLKYADAVIAKHPDLEVAGAVLVARLQQADASDDAEAARAAYQTLQEQRFADSPARITARVFNPDRPIQEGRPMPPVVTGSVDWAERMRGKVYLIELWATWCVGCIQAMPKVHEAYELVAPMGFEMVSISFDPDPALVEDLRKQWPMPWHHAFPSQAEQQQLFEVFGVQLPRTVLVAADGKILAVDLPWTDLPVVVKAALYRSP